LANWRSNTDNNFIAAIHGLSGVAGFHFMNKWLFQASDFLSAPSGFYTILVTMAACTVLVPFGWTDVITYALSVLAIVITGIVLIQG
jgi:low affinity Fe/Cu permease